MARAAPTAATRAGRQRQGQAGSAHDDDKGSAWRALSSSSSSWAAPTAGRQGSAHGSDDDQTGQVYSVIVMVMANQGHFRKI